MMASSMGLARPMGLVWEVAGSMERRRVHGESEGRTRVTRGRDALARPGLVAACSGASWARLGMRRAGVCGACL
jgi:hypothetical protein